MDDEIQKALRDQWANLRQLIKEQEQANREELYDIRMRLMRLEARLGEAQE